MATQGQRSHDKALRRYKMFLFSFMALNGINACKCTLECTDEPSSAWWGKPMLHFRSCGTSEEFHVYVFTILRTDYFHLLTGLSALECFCLSSLAAKVLDASHHHRICTKMFARRSSHPFLYFNISFCWRTSAFYDWSNILFIWSDLYAFRYLVITPCFKKKELIERK